MYIIYQGEVKVLAGENEDKVVATLGDNKVFGDSALEKLND